jgi:rare lipoprotein A
MSRWPVTTCVCLVGLVLSGAACHKKSARTRVPRLPAGASGRAVPGPPAEAIPGSVEYGYASWYGNPYHGRKTTSGEVYDMYLFTAAHRTLPLGTEVEVTNLENSQKVMVKINDRGPFVDGRIIDLSLSAARAISMVGPGTALVQVKVLRVGTLAMARAAGPSNTTPGSVPGAPPSAAANVASSAAPAVVPSAVVPMVADRFTVQVGAFSDRRNAERLRDDLTRRYPQYSVNSTAAPDGRLYRVWVGNEASQQQAAVIVERLRQDGFTAFALRLD